MQTKRILFINFGGLGDEILFLPTIQSVKKEFPNSRITLALEERSKGKDIEIKPERIDMTEQEVDILMETPIEEVFEKSKEELKEFADIDGNVNFAKAVDEINENLNKKINTRLKKKVSDDE